MVDSAALAGFAGLLADQTRAAMCLALLNGKPWTMGQLAKHAGVAPSTASAHLTLLVAGGMLADEHKGRHRYLRLADRKMAGLLEDILSHIDSVEPKAAMARARTCYDHIGGELGVAISDAMLRQKLIVDSGFALTKDGLAWLEQVGVDVAALQATRRTLARPCLDWTERRFHLAGAAGAALCRTAFDSGWIERTKSERALRLTPAGTAAFAGLLGVTPESLS
ncbi:ArsR/SmtB family transcription factor [Catelliglobosispora koreensis]|uniref:ArsR/SmtB family transcription factor n=1 Tax=Catelliglobosispora koreensis TaxID=129052 RepID=UPI00035F7848|nr:helix-turn-helix transcriptional regulator [Catelliglobosispora koreensis]